MQCSSEDLSNNEEGFVEPSLQPVGNLLVTGAQATTEIFLYILIGDCFDRGIAVQERLRNMRKLVWDGLLYDNGARTMVGIAFDQVKCTPPS